MIATRHWAPPGQFANARFTHIRVLRPAPQGTDLRARSAIALLPRRAGRRSLLDGLTQIFFDDGKLRDHLLDAFAIDAERAPSPSFPPRGPPSCSSSGRAAGGQKQPLGAAIFGIGTALDQAVVAKPVEQPGQRDRLQVESCRVRCSGLSLDALPVRWVGARSYGIYLWHWPVLVLVVAAAPTWQDSAPTQWLIGVVTVAITLTAATLSYHFIERPIRRMGFRAWLRRGWVGEHRGLRIASASVVALLIVAGIGGTATAIVRAPASGTAQGDIKAGIVALAKAKYLPPPPPGAPGSNMIGIGDSVMLASAPELKQVYPAMAIDAVVSRQMNTLPGIVQALIHKRQIRQILVVGLGTNGPIARSTLVEVRNMLGPNRQMILVNVEEPRVWESEVNYTLAHFADDYQNVELANWYGAILPHISILAPDHIHPGPTGGRIYTSVVTAALNRLKALPPYPTVSDFFSTTPLPTTSSH